MSVIEDLRTPAELEAFLANPGLTPVLIFKHSTRCAISARAHAAFVAAANGGDLQPARLGRVRVIEERDVSNAITDRLQMAHASPQALLIQGGRVVWHATHDAITRAALTVAAAAAARGATVAR